MQQWESVSTSEKCESSDNYYKIMFFIYVVTVMGYIFNSCGDSCVQWRQLCVVETVVCSGDSCV